MLRSLLYPSVVAFWIFLLVPGALRDPDIWWHLRNAAITLNTHAWLTHDVYSYTAAGVPWIDHEWLAELPFSAAWRIAGTAGPCLVTLLTIEIIFIALFHQCRTSTSRPSPHLVQSPLAATCATVLAALLATVSFGPRTLLFGWLCLICELQLLNRITRSALVTRNDCVARDDRFAEDRKTLLALPPLFTLWVNLHGSWLIGLVLLLVFILCGSVRFHVGSIVSHGWTPRQRRKLALVFTLCIAALFINPYGWRLVFYPFDLAFHQQLNVASVQEWQPLTLQSTRGLILFVTVSALFAGQLIRRRDWTLTELAFGAIGIYAACRHARFLFLAGILIAPLITRSFDRRKRRVCTPQPRAVVTAGLLFAMVAVAIAVKLKAPPNRQEAGFPASAIPYLKTLPFSGRLFNECLWGGYLIDHLPGVRIFIDSRMDLYERNGVLRDYLDIIHLKNSLALLDRYNIRYVLFEKDTPLIYLLRQTRDWKTDYDDGDTVLLERATALAKAPQ